MGRLIPAGTGADPYRTLDLPVPEPVAAEPEEDILSLETGADDATLAQLLAGGGDLGSAPSSPPAKQ